MVDPGPEMGGIHYLIGAYLVGYGVLVLLGLMGLIPGPVTSGLTVGYLLWALGVGLVPFGVYYFLAAWRKRGYRAPGPKTVP